MSLVQALFAHDPVGFTEFQNVLDALSKVCIILDMIFYFLLIFIQGPGSTVGNVGLQHTKRPGSPESLQQLIEIARNNVSTTTGFVAVKDEKVKLPKDKKVYDLI
jgi:CCR4-NOT transcription complex subunit 1